MTGRYRRVVSSALLGVTVSVLLNASSRPQAARAPAMAEVLKAVRALQGVQAPGYPPVEVPPQARPMLTALKRALRDLVTSQIDTIPDDSAQEIQSGITNALVRSGVLLSQRQQSEEGYAGIVGIKVAQPKGHPNLLAAVTTLQIPCGEDSSLYVYERERTKWRLKVAFEADDYPKVNGALGMFEYRVSPSDAFRRWFVVIADVNPWCTSNWQDLRYEVLRPASSTAIPKVIFKDDDGVYRGYGSPYKLALNHQGFTLVYRTFQSLDAAVLIRTAVAKYKVTDDHVTRTSPLAIYPEGFLDAWVELPWPEARRWTAKRARATAEQWHAKLQSATRADTQWFTSFDFVQACPSHESWQIGVSSDTNKNLPGIPPEVYFTVARHQGEFEVRSVALKRPPGCPGEAHPVRQIDLLPDPRTIK